MLTLTNSSDVTVSIDEVEVGGPDPEAFDLTSETCTGAELPPDGRCRMTVSFAGREPGAYDARLVIHSDASPRRQQVALAGRIEPADPPDEGASSGSPAESGAGPPSLDAPTAPPPVSAAPEAGADSSSRRDGQTRSERGSPRGDGDESGARRGATPSASVSQGNSTIEPPGGVPAPVKLPAVATTTEGPPAFSLAPRDMLASGSGLVVLLLLLGLFPMMSLLGGSSDDPAPRGSPYPTRGRA